MMSFAVGAGRREVFWRGGYVGADTLKVERHAGGVVWVEVEMDLWVVVQVEVEVDP